MGRARATFEDEGRKILAELAAEKHKPGLSEKEKGRVDLLVEELKQDFGDVAFGEDAQAMLRSLREGLAKADEVTGLDAHREVAFVNLMMRGQDGRSGLAKALLYDYLNTGNGVTNATGKMIVEVAKTFMGDYVDIDYGLGSVYAGNWQPVSYQQPVTGRFTKEGFSYTTGKPLLDCSGFVDMVYYAAGLTGVGNQRNNRSSLNLPRDWKTVVGPENAFYRQEQAMSGTAGSVDERYSGKEYLSGGHARGVTQIFYDNRLSWTNTGQAGDLVFMYGGDGYHIGILGFDDAGSMQWLHSAPAIRFNVGTRQNPDFVDFASGPRVNSQYDAYATRFLGYGSKENHFNQFLNLYTYQFGRWRY